MTIKTTGSRITRSGITVKDAVLDGCLLETKLPVKAFATLTTHASQVEFNDSFYQWVRGVQPQNRSTLAWIKTYESVPQRHAHVALIASAPLNCSRAESLWRAIAAPGYPESALVKPSGVEACRLGYIWERLHPSVENIEFSDNLLGFAIEDWQSKVRSTSARRRPRRARSFDSERTS